MSEMIAQYSTVCLSFAAFPGAAVWKVLQDSTVENAILRLIGPAAFTMRKRAKHLDSATLMVSVLPGRIPELILTFARHCPRNYRVAPVQTTCSLH